MCSRSSKSWIAPTCSRPVACASREPRPNSRVTRSSARPIWDCSAMDPYLLEAAINGLLLGGVLALLALGLNLIFGVIDVVWIAYADLVMCGMYAVFWLYSEFGWPLPLAGAGAI